MKRHLLILSVFCAAIFAQLFATQIAEAGIGDIWFTNTTSSSLTVNWLEPDSPYTPVGSEPYKVCWKKYGFFNWTNVCNVNQQNTPNTSFTISNLEDDTKYKVRVRCYCKKSGIFGGTKWRNIETDYANTLPEQVPADGTMWITEVENHAIELAWQTNNVPNPGYSRVCYKALHSGNWFWSLKNNCKKVYLDYAFPTPLHIPPTWNSDFLRGWHQTNSAVTSGDVRIDGLLDCMPYKFALYVFDRNNTENGELIDIRTQRTQGCNWWNWFAMVQDEHDDVHADYALALDKLYGDAGVYDTLVNQYPEIPTRFNAEEEDLRDTAVLLKYLVREQQGVLDKWQQSDELQRAGMSLEQYLEREHPELYEFLSVELDPTQDDDKEEKR